MGKVFCWGVLAVALGAAGCGTPGAPLPPSLNLPTPVDDLAAVRAGDRVKLTWTMPRRTTDKVNLKGEIAVQVCRKLADGPCVAAAEMRLLPSADGAFTDSLVGDLASGAPRPLRYFVELKNGRGRSAGLSNAAEVLAGQAPDAVGGLAAEVRKQGVVLRWTEEPGGDAIRLHRRMLNPPPPSRHAGPLEAPPEPVEQNLLVSTEEGRALDKSISFGHTYEYTAQRIARVDVDGKTLELAGPVSAPVRVEAEDVFPPAVPTGLAAVATPASDGAPASIDLNWQPVSDADLAGYFVYRREAESPWRRISGERPIAAPAFHDADVHAGHTYIYGVSAVDEHGHESGRSADAQETVPNP